MSDTESNPDQGRSTSPQHTAPASPPATAGAANAPAAPRKPKIGDSMPAPPSAAGADTTKGAAGSSGSDPAGTGPSKNRRRRRRGRGGGGGGNSGASGGGNPQGGQGGQQRQGGGQKGGQGGQQRQGGGQKGQRGQQPTPVEAVLVDDKPLELDEKTLKRRGGRSRKGRAVGRYQMNVHVHDDATQIVDPRGSIARRALRVTTDRRRHPDPRQHLHRQGRERAARHGGGVHRHRDARRTRCSTGATSSTTRTTSTPRANRPASRTCSRRSS